MFSGRVVCLAMALAASSVACRDTPSGPTGSDGIPGFTLGGDPASSSGATWSYVAQESSIAYDLQGILLKPTGAGPFPAVIISHGRESSAGSYSLDVARVMVGWGLVCIATNYTFAGGVPIGAPGDSSEASASPNNVARARRLVDILSGLGYVDMNRVALHGHSAGAFVTEVTAAAHPDLFRAASHTAGGIASNESLFPPTESEIANIRAPYQMHHGERDDSVPLVADELFAAALRRRGVVNELLTYPGAGHDDISLDPAVLNLIRGWYRSKGVL
jgi:dienelactone hydrolase